MARKLILGITQGDSNGIGYEVIIKALSDERILELCTPVIYGSSKIFGFYKKQLHNIGQINTNLISNAREAHPKRVNILNCLSENISAEPGLSTPDAAKAAIISLQKGVEDLKNGEIDALVTAPINKRAMDNEGFGFTGHTEYLKKCFDADDVTDIKLFKEFIKVLADSIALDVNLHSAVGVFHICENGFSHDPERRDSSGNDHMGMFFRIRNKERAGFFNRHGAVKTFAERFDSGFGEFFGFGSSLRENVFRFLFGCLICLFCHFP